MTDEEINVKVAEALGFFWDTWGKSEIRVTAPIGIPCNWIGQDECKFLRLPISKGETAEQSAHGAISRICPPFAASLDACSQFEKTLKDDEIKHYLNSVHNEVMKGVEYNEWKFFTASPLQRCKAYLIVKGVEV